MPFIQPENMEKAIEEALANPVDVNFAIDLDGYVYRGKETSIDNIPEEKRERLCSNWIVLNVMHTKTSILP